METLGERIQRVRLSKHMTRKTLGEKLELNHPEIRISAYENDKVYPRNKMIDKIAKVLNVSENYLLTGNLDNETYENMFDDGILDILYSNENLFFDLVLFCERNKQKIIQCFEIEDYLDVECYILEKVENYVNRKKQGSMTKSTQGKQKGIVL